MAKSPFVFELKIFFDGFIFLLRIERIFFLLRYLFLFEQLLNRLSPFVNLMVGIFAIIDKSFPALKDILIFVIDIFYFIVHGRQVTIISCLNDFFRIVSQPLKIFLNFSNHLFGAASSIRNQKRIFVN